MSGYDELQLAGLLAALPPAPQGWVRAAQELPLARLGLDDLVRRAEEDAVFRQRLIADLEAALQAEGIEPDPALADALRRRGQEAAAASLTAEVGIAVFRIAFERWIAEGEDRDLAELIRESLGQLQAVTASG